MSWGFVLYFLYFFQYKTTMGGSLFFDIDSECFTSVIHATNVQTQQGQREQSVFSIWGSENNCHNHLFDRERFLCFFGKLPVFSRLNVTDT
jgi:hypothetical protein